MVIDFDILSSSNANLFSLYSNIANYAIYMLNKVAVRVTTIKKDGELTQSYPM